MNIKKLLVAAFFLSISIGSVAYISYEERHPVVSNMCIQNCIEQGYTDGYCLRVCSY